VVVDEVSMLDIHIFRCLLDALRPDTALILLGDQNQLPSVGAGAVLGDIAAPFYRDAVPAGRDQPVPSLSAGTHAFLSAALQTPLPRGLIRSAADLLRDRFVVLVKNHRSHTAVTRVAFEINTPALRETVARDLFANEAAEIEIASIAKREPGVYRASGSIGRCEEQWFRALYGKGYVACVKELCRELEQALLSNAGSGQTLAMLRRTMNASYRACGLFSLLDAGGVLCIVREGPAGCVEANRLAARTLCRPDDSVLGAGLFSGCIAMVTRNMRQLGLFNGDRGIVLGVLGQRYLALRKQPLNAAVPRMFDLFPAEEIPALEPAFAITVHKSQGSEFANVMLVLTPGDHFLLTREIVYTAVTRAKERVVICGSHEALELGVGREMVRRSGLHERMAEAGSEIAKGIKA
jgi:exodeoxyribonuclease V alpha subunit